MKIMDNLCNKCKPLRVYHKIDTFVVNKDEWDTNEGHGKSMKNALYVQWYAPLGLK